ncbi:MAG: SPOR domain-containing protein [Devosiaceae bacterium]|nr:SPOR domain-containing protein [Devosiaceae bacterium]
MDTAKPLNPPKNDEAADDLIEELARLMADDAQSSTASAPPPPAAAPAARPESATTTSATTTSDSHQSGSPSQGFSDSASKQTAFDVQDGSTTTKTGEPSFDMKGFALGAPKAEVSNLTSTPASPQTSAHQAAPRQLSSSSTSSSASADSSVADFDFGFGVGPDSTSTGSNNDTPRQSQNTAPGTISSTPEPSVTAVQPVSDPIADLINAAVSKHTLPDIAPAPQQPAPQQAAPQQAAPPVTPSSSSAPSVSHLPLARGSLGAGSSAKISGTKDEFASPPVFGLSGKPSSSANNVTKTPGTAPDANRGAMALDEIESLIGNSVQVDAPVDAPADFNAQQAVENGPRTVQTSAKIPTAANIAPQSHAGLNNTAAAKKISAAKTPSGEGGILRAMSNSGAAVAKLRTFMPPTPGSAAKKAAVAKDLPNTAVGTDEDLQLAAGRASFDEQQSRGLSRYVAPVVGVLFVGAVGFGLYTLFNPGTGEGNAPVLRADGSPTRQAPDAVETGTQSVVLNGIDGVAPVAQGEQLVSRDQSAGLNGSAIRQVDTLDTSETGLANRRVRTVTVRPDGTIISGADAVAGGEVLNAAQPALPDLPASAINTELSSTTVAALPQNPAIGLNASLESIATPNPTEAPTPRPRLANRDALAAVIANSQSATSTVAQTTPGAVNLVSAAPSVTATPVANAAPASNALSQPILNPGAFVQLASQRDEGIANQTAATLQARFSSSLQGGSLLVRRVDLGTRGIYYRVQLPTNTLAQANSICESIKGAGGDCFVRNS